MFHGHSSSQQVFVARDEVTFSGFAGTALLQLEFEDQGRTELFEPELRREFRPSGFNTRMSL